MKRSGARLAARFSVVAACLVGAGPTDAATTSGTLGVTATVLSKNVCKLSNANVLTLDFSTIDPTSRVDVTRQLTWSFSCGGSSPQVAWVLGTDTGQNPDGNQRRMSTGTLLNKRFLAYSLSITPSQGTADKSTTVNVTISGTVAASDFNVAVPGPYTDAVIITLSP
jgi:hypothetical protein